MLKPCPFCGYTRPELWDDDVVGVVCVVCPYTSGGCGASSLYHDKHDEDKCITAWNLRAEVIDFDKVYEKGGT